MAREQKNLFPVRLRFVVLFLILLALLLAAVGTVAWMRHIRSLQTATLVQVTSLSLEGPNPNTPNTAIINLGDKDISTGGSASYVFGVRTNNVPSFTVQLAHTTNIPFTYTIYPATPVASGQTPDITEDGASFVKSATSLSGEYANQTALGSNLARRDDDYYNSTYGVKGSVYGNVQKNAMPLYWQSSNISPSSENSVTYFILEVSWTAGENDKETDMVYLTVGTGGGA